MTDKKNLEGITIISHLFDISVKGTASKGEISLSVYESDNNSPHKSIKYDKTITLNSASEHYEVLKQSLFAIRAIMASEQYSKPGQDEGRIKD